MFRSFFFFFFKYCFSLLWSLRTCLDWGEKKGEWRGVELIPVWILHLCPCLDAKWVSSSFFFCRNFWLFSHEQCTVHCSRVPQTSHFSNFFIKNGFYGIIHTFKNYFTTIFFNFQLYPNGPLAENMLILESTLFPLLFLQTHHKLVPIHSFVKI